VLQKLIRNITAFLPIARTRKGTCRQCGECCRLPYACPMLGYDGEGRAYCRIYRFRPLSCKKYPRTEAECLTTTTCGFRFEEEV
jgi:hypothetical protein